MGSLALNSGLFIGLGPLPGVVSGSSSSVIASVNADGWTAEWRTGTPPTFNPDTAPENIAVSRGGYQGTAGYPGSVSTTSYADTVVPTLRVRSAAPNDATLDADSVILSDYVYSSDTIAGVTNSSTVESPKPVAQFSEAGRRLIDSNSADPYTFGVIAGHRDGIAAVVGILRDTGGTEIRQTVIAPTFNTRAGDWTGVIEYRFSFPAADISTLANGTIRRRAIVYPYFGSTGSVLDTNDSTDEGRGTGTRLDWKGPKYYVYVDTGGSDAAGAATVSTDPAAAALAPAATFAGAIARARVVMPGNRIPGLEVRLNAGTWSNTGVTFNTYQNADTAEVIVTRNPSVARASVIWSWSTANNFYLLYIRAQDLTMNRTAAVNFGSNISQIVLRDIDWSGLTTPGTSLQSGAVPVYYEGGITFPAGLGLGGFLYALNVQMVRGCQGGSLTSVSNVLNLHVAGCKFLGVLVDNNTTGVESNLICVESYLAQPTNGTNSVVNSGTIAGATSVGILHRNLVLENNNATSGNPSPNRRFSADGSGSNIDHLISLNVSGPGALNGGRDNAGYDESAATTRRTHRLWRFEGNFIAQFNHKTDRFVSYMQLNGDSVNRTGAWSVTMGVGFRDNMYQYLDAGAAGGGSYAGASRTTGTGSFSQEYGGLNLSKATTTTPLNPLFTAPAHITWNGSAYTSGTGNGTYTLQSGSPLKTKQTVRRSTPAFDVAGNARGSLGSTTSIGAYV